MSDTLGVIKQVVCGLPLLLICWFGLTSLPPPRHVLPPDTTPTTTLPPQDHTTAHRHGAPPTFYSSHCDITFIGTWEEVAADKGFIPTAHEKVASTTRVAVFKSIPFAMPPVGKRRLRSPLDLACPLSHHLEEVVSPHDHHHNDHKAHNKKKRKMAYNATQFKAVCPQTPLTQPTTLLGREDCLYLTLHVPEHILAGEGDRQWPVLLYIYGGSYIMGDESEPLSFLAANTPAPKSGEQHRQLGVVVVVPNYRLGGLGWMAISAMAEEAEDDKANTVGNFGLQDQVSALRWVQRSIHMVGGDKNRVTIMGQSSGGTSVLALSQSPAAAGRNLFRAGISLSGSPNTTMDAATKFRQDEAYATALGCERAPRQPQATQMECLRNVPVAQFVGKMPASWNTPGLWSLDSLKDEKKRGLQLPGLIYVDGKLLPHSLEESLRLGEYPHITLVIGSTGQEGNVADFFHPKFTAKLATMPTKVWQQYLEHDVFANGFAKADVAAIEKLYAPASKVNPLLSYYSIHADVSLGCASRKLGQLAGKARSSSWGSRKPHVAPVYIFSNQWPPSSPNNNGWLSYSYHMWDYLCGIQNWNLFPGQHFTPTNDDLALSSLLRRHWGAIIYDAQMTTEDRWHSVLDSAEHTNTYVYSRKDRYPFFAHSGVVRGYQDRKCSLLRKMLGTEEPYWWSD